MLLICSVSPSRQRKLRWRKKSARTHKAQQGNVFCDVRRRFTSTSSLSAKHHQSHLIKIFSNHKVPERCDAMFSQVDESFWSETARFWKAIKSVNGGRWNGDDFIFMTVQLSSTTESNGGNISHLNFRPFARFQQTTSTSASKHTQYQVKKNEHRKLLRSIRAEIITFKLPIFLFMINMNSRCFGMEGGRKLKKAAWVRRWEIATFHFVYESHWNGFASISRLSWIISIREILASLSRKKEKANII